MKRLPYLSLLATTLPLVFNAAALAAPPSGRLENSLTAGGLNIAPRYLDKVGDVALNLQGGYVRFPDLNSSLVGLQVGLQSRVTDRLQLLANIGSNSQVGLRGPLWSDDSTVLGWDAHYRAELYLAEQPTVGLRALFLDTAPGAISQGGEITFNAMKSWENLNLYAAPLVAVMSNRTSLGLDAGLDLKWNSFDLGYALDARYNANPASPAVRSSEYQHSVGLRCAIIDRIYAQLNYYLVPADTYGLSNQMLLMGIGTRLHAEIPTRVLTSAFMPKPTPVQTATPMPTPVPTATPVPISVSTPTPAPIPKGPVSMQGRVYHSLVPGGDPGRSLTVRLKRRSSDGSFDKVTATTQTDVHGNYSFRGLSKGVYQIYYKDEGNLPNTVDVAISEVQVSKDGSLTRNLDIAFSDEGFRETVAGGTVTITWPSKPNAPDALYQGLLHRVIQDNDKAVIAFPAIRTEASTGSFTISPKVTGDRLYYFIKYWKKGNSFNGSGYYGQTKPRELKLDRVSTPIH